MKEIGKLLELLNEYDSGWDYDDYYGPYQYGQDRDAYKYGKYYLLSRDYGFIKWLVENDKIETNNLSLKAFKNIFSGGGFVEVSDLEVLLMLLAISDTPIEDLILYLK